MNENATVQSRNEKLQELGLLCYNLSVDGKSHQGLSSHVEEVKQAICNFFAIRQNTENETTIAEAEGLLNEKLFRLGSMCSELYALGEKFTDEVDTLCKEVIPVSQASWTPVDTGANYRNRAEGNYVADNTYGNVQEPAPQAPLYKECACGFRNELDYKFCVMCGNKLD